MGVHTCEAEYREGDYFGSEVNRAARLMSVAHGGQVVVSSATAGLVRDGSVELVDLGEHRLRDLTARGAGLPGVAPGLAREFPPLRSLDALLGNLPRAGDGLRGARGRSRVVGGLVLGSSLVTLTGVGGVGKTSLALQVAGDVADEFPDGAWLCELAPVADPDAVWDTLAASLRVQRNPGRRADLAQQALSFQLADRSRMRRVAAPFIAFWLSKSHFTISVPSRYSVDMPRRVIAFPRDEDVPAPPILAHRLKMLPYKVTVQMGGL